MTTDTHLTPEYLAAIRATAITGRLTTDVSPLGEFAVVNDDTHVCYMDTLSGAETIRTLLSAVPQLLDEIDRLRALDG